MSRGRGSNHFRRGGRGRGRGGGMRNTNRAAPKRKNIPRARPNLRATGVNQLATNLVRRQYWYPAKFVKSEPGPTPEPDTWWLSGIKAIGSVAMKIITSLFLAAPADAFDMPMADIVVPIGAIMRIGLSAEDLLVQSNFTQLSEPGNDNSTLVTHYRQAKLEWIKITVNPQAQSRLRGGTLYASIRSVTGQQYNQDVEALGTSPLTIQDMTNSGPITTGPASRPLAITYAPEIGDSAYGWNEIGQQNKEGTIKGACPLVYFTMGYSNPAADTKDLTEEYDPAHAMFEVIHEARFEFRTSDIHNYVRQEPPLLDKSTTVSVVGLKTRRNIDLADLVSSPRYPHLLGRPVTLDCLGME
jgi:hypothetical protein